MIGWELAPGLIFRDNDLKTWFLWIQNWFIDFFHYEIRFSRSDENWHQLAPGLICRENGLKTWFLWKQSWVIDFFPLWNQIFTIGWELAPAGARPYMSWDTLFLLSINRNEKWRRIFKTGAERVLKSYFWAAHIKLAPDENSGFWPSIAPLKLMYYRKKSAVTRWSLICLS